MTSTGPVMVECGKTCFVIFLGLILMTAGFVLTLTGWFAPPLSNFVLAVRMGGPITLLVGFAFLLCSCLMCAIEQGKCCHCCYSFFLDKSLTGLTIARHPETNGPLILHDDDGVQCAETQVDLTDDEDIHVTHRGELVIDESMVVVNEGAAEADEEEEDEENDLPSPSKYPKGYQPLATSECDKVDIVDENEFMGLNGFVIPNVSLQSDTNMTKRIGRLEVVPCPPREVLLDGDRCYSFNKGYGYDKVPNVDPPCYTSIQTANKHNEFESASVNSVINSAFTPYNSTSCGIPRLKTLEASTAASDTLFNSQSQPKEEASHSSPSISRPPLFPTSYPGAMCSFPAKASCPGMRPGVCGHHPRTPCPLTPKNRRQRSQLRRAERSSQSSASHNINKVNRMYMEPVVGPPIANQKQQLLKKQQENYPKMDVTVIPSCTKEKNKVNCRGVEGVVSSQV